MKAPQRAIDFAGSSQWNELLGELEQRLQKVSSDIILASRIDNVKERGNMIEYLITSKEEETKAALLHFLEQGGRPPQFTVKNDLGDLSFNCPDFMIEIDIKSKQLSLESVPKGATVDKLLRFLAQKGSVFLFYLVAVEKDGRIATQICSMFDQEIIEGSTVNNHWSGRNTRGTVQYDGKMLKRLVGDLTPHINLEQAEQYIETLLNR